MSWVEEPRFNLQLQIRTCRCGTVPLSFVLGHGVTVGFNHDVAGSRWPAFAGLLDSTEQQFQRAWTSSEPVSAGAVLLRLQPGSRGLPALLGDDLEEMRLA